MRPPIPTATVSRMVTYLRVLARLELAEVPTTSSARIADEAQVSAFQVRKDLTYLDNYAGTRGVGYPVGTLRQALIEELGLGYPWRVAIVGMGRLGQALVDYPGLDDYNFVLRAGFDVDRSKTDHHAEKLPVWHVEDMTRIVGQRQIDIGFLTVPAGAAQDAADHLVAAGVSGILNFAPTVIKTPGHVYVEPVDFLAGLKRLSFYIHRSRSTKEESA